jgi:hypothetical protein
MRLRSLLLSTAARDLPTLAALEAIEGLSEISPQIFDMFDPN